MRYGSGFYTFNLKCLSLIRYKEYLRIQVLKRTELIKKMFFTVIAKTFKITINKYKKIPTYCVFSILFLQI